ncbi:MAG: GNAT family N-acetyltransferase, partial [Gammaproteobacteria bacterium]|nr:GNAT family N-acetyltransferase [Gammaproteobacteria bacterium]
AGLQLAPGGLASSADQAARIADDVGYPVAAKLASREIQHKTDIGAVQLGLDGPDQVRRAFHEIERRVKDERGDVAMEGVLVQPLLSGSAEVMIGVQ